jgi:Xaa-Pro aminopeptidase
MLKSNQIETLNNSRNELEKMKGLKEAAELQHKNNLANIAREMHREARENMSFSDFQQIVRILADLLNTEGEAGFKNKD